MVLSKNSKISFVPTFPGLAVPSYILTIQRLSLGFDSTVERWFWDEEARENG